MTTFDSKRDAATLATMSYDIVGLYAMHHINDEGQKVFEFISPISEMDEIETHFKKDGCIHVDLDEMARFFHYDMIGRLPPRLHEWMVGAERARTSLELEELEQLRFVTESDLWCFAPDYFAAVKTHGGFQCGSKVIPCKSPVAENKLLTAYRAARRAQQAANLVICAETIRKAVDEMVHKGEHKTRISFKQKDQGMYKLHYREDRILATRLITFDGRDNNQAIEELLQSMEISYKFEVDLGNDLLLYVKLA